MPRVTVERTLCVAMAAVASARQCWVCQRAGRLPFRRRAACPGARVRRQGRGRAESQANSCSHPSTPAPAHHLQPTESRDGRDRRLPCRLLAAVLLHPHQRIGRVDASPRKHTPAHAAARRVGRKTSLQGRCNPRSPATATAPAAIPRPPSQIRGILAALKVKTTDVDGANAENKERRSELWAISGKRAVYPQVFVRAKGETKFIGDGEDIVLANDDGILKGQLADAPRVEEPDE